MPRQERVALGSGGAPSLAIVQSPAGVGPGLASLGPGGTGRPSGLAAAIDLKPRLHDQLIEFLEQDLKLSSSYEQNFYQPLPLT